ncbi:MULTISPECIES: hypothetical protein [Nonomuraea]|uniref:Uncharacterized protein n=1 Tax=Nonomuraea mangrovi TaxID=2316207 RepID=A0ABW4TCQ9_9ACTN
MGRWSELPGRVLPEDMVELHETEPPRDDVMGAGLTREQVLMMTNLLG